MEEISYQLKKRETKKLTDIALIFIYLSNIMNFLGPIATLINSIIVIFVTILLWKGDRFFLILPILLFYGSFLVLPLGLRIFDIYCILFFIKVLVAKKLLLQKRFITPLLILVTYALSVVAYHNIRTSIIIIISSLFIMLYISVFFTNENRRIVFMRAYVYSTISASIYGFIKLSSLSDNYVIIDGLVTAITRNIGTFIDPNYFGFFINIAIFIVIINNVNFSARKRSALIIFFYISLLSTISLTAILCNTLGILLYNIIKKTHMIKSITIGIIIFSIIVMLWNIALDYNVPIVSDLVLRVQSLNLGKNDLDFNLITTSRSFIWKKHLNYFTDQPPYRILFGGNFITDYGFSSQFKGVSHQVFIDMLLNFGIVGTLMFISGFAANTLRIIKSFKIEKKKETLESIFIKYIWIFYAFGLSMFPSWIFNIFFFI